MKRVTIIMIILVIDSVCSYAQPIMKIYKSGGVLDTYLMSNIDSIKLGKVLDTCLISNIDSVKFGYPVWVQVDGGAFAAGFRWTGGPSMVTISPFKIDKYEVTYELWTAVRNWGLTHGYTDLPLGQNGTFLSSNVFVVTAIGTFMPVTMVNWYDVIKWCNARSEKDGLTPVYHTGTPLINSNVYRTGNIDINIEDMNWNANGYRLPTEAEWDFASRGGTKSGNYAYSGSNVQTNVAWSDVNSENSTHQVGTKSPNELGIYDMSGNVWEWCGDLYGSAYPSGGTLDPKGPSEPQGSRLLRGGCFFNDTLNARRGESASNQCYDGGFRCVQD